MSACLTNSAARSSGGEPLSTTARRSNVRLGLTASAGYHLDAEALDDVAGAHVLVVLEGHAAFLAGRDFRDFVLEALERLQLAFVDDDVVADQADARATLDLAFGDTAAGDLADLGDVEDLQDLGIAEKVSRRSGDSRPDSAAFTSSTRL